MLSRWALYWFCIEFNCLKLIFITWKNSPANLVGEARITLGNLIKDSIGELDSRGDLVLSWDLAENSGSLLAGCTEDTSHLNHTLSKSTWLIKIEIYCMENIIVLVKGRCLNCASKLTWTYRGPHLMFPIPVRERLRFPESAQAAFM